MIPKQYIWPIGLIFYAMLFISDRPKELWNDIGGGAILAFLLVWPVLIWIVCGVAALIVLWIAVRVVRHAWWS